MSERSKELYQALSGCPEVKKRGGAGCVRLDPRKGLGSRTLDVSNDRFTLKPELNIL